MLQPLPPRLAMISARRQSDGLIRWVRPRSPANALEQHGTSTATILRRQLGEDLLERAIVSGAEIRREPLQRS